MNIETMFLECWAAYSKLNPKVLEMRALLAQHSSGLLNDHIALRTLKHAEFGLGQLYAPFEEIGYEVREHYHFKEKKLDAVHLEHSNIEGAPKVFISELLLEHCSPELQDLISRELVDRYQPVSDALLPVSGVSWGQPSYSVYQTLLQESEYAAWFYVFGFVPNHFTVKVNSLSDVDSLNDIHVLNAFLEEHGYQLNSAGGKVKGSPEIYLEQSSTLADKVSIQFQEGMYDIPSVFYEFAKRYSLPSGEEFSGFVEGNANKIFESTNVRET